MAFQVVVILLVVMLVMLVILDSDWQTCWTRPS